MKLIPKEEIDREKWDVLVKRFARGIHSYSWWLDEISESWCVYSDSEYTQGIALPFTERAGVKTLYNPIFSEYSEWFGEVENIESLQNILTSNFDRGIFGMENHELELEKEMFTVQRLTNKKPYSKMALRNIKKATEFGFELVWGDDFDLVFKCIETELRDRATGMTKLNFARLKKALIQADKRSFLKILGIRKEGVLCGGILFLESRNLFYYVKGAVNSEFKSKGAIYLGMDAGIQYAHEKELEFDFGGSRIEGVRRFNLQFGGEDVIRPFYTFNSAPKWYNLLQKFRKMTP
ncbi:MAG: GNAT family N-acetyltransferase [Cryomorphaceae bacterium]|jgi:hypothetical protein|nr:GNAT family N-acetyltransferase [Cryomorphaceae bacterium]